MNTMKRLVSLLLTCLILFSIALAESVDLDAMSDEALIELQGEIDAEMASRSIIGQIIYEGRYIVGDEIQAGTYNVFCLESVENDDVDIDLSGVEDLITDWINLDVGEAYHIRLENGTILDVNRGKAILILDENRSYMP